ncbi:MAG: nicotinate-nucleotide--dimethylbenzimidazole phosphoribosyltransferase [Spirochaetota bacterium]
MESGKYTKDIREVKQPALEKEILKRLDDLTKPPGSLGRLEDFVVQYCLCRGDSNARIKNTRLVTFAGDHGITEEKITPYPREVTVQMVSNMLAGGAAISVMCRNAGIESWIVDIGTCGEYPDHPALLKKKIARGTRNFLNAPAMTEEECDDALEVGYKIGSEKACDLFGIGEMGIGNSSSASALFSLLLDIDPEQTVGEGTGSRGKLFEHKKSVIARSVDFHRKEWDGTAFDALRRLGGFEIAGMTGLILAAAGSRIPVVVDGFIASAAALVAIKMEKKVTEYLFFSHASGEKFHKGFLAIIGKKPILDLDMRLGEGTGAALAMQIIMQALNCYHQMATFSSAGVSNAD